MQDGPSSLQVPPVVVLPSSSTSARGLQASGRPSSTHTTLVLPPRLQRRPGMAVRTREVDHPPIPPPRPESTLSSRSKPVIPVKSSSVTLNIPSVPPRPHAARSPPRLPSPPPPPPPLALSSPTLPSPPVSSISLTSPRPSPNRSQNVYVDTPLRTALPVVMKQPTSRSGPGTFSLPQSTPSSKRVPSAPSSGSSSPESISGGGKRPLLLASQQLSSVIQPSSRSTLKKSNDLDGNSSDFEAASAAAATFSQESIICRDCGRCRCKACREPRRLPEHYLCHKKCLCSPETVVDTLSCMCLVKALFYHCGKDYVAEADSVFENPCSCSGEFTAARWGCMAALSLCMPCLLCYLPLKGCAQACETVYSKCTSSGCQCDAATNGAKMSTSKDAFVSTSFFDSVRNNNVDIDDGGRRTVSPGSVSPVDSEKRLLSEQ